MSAQNEDHQMGGVEENAAAAAADKGKGKAQEQTMQEEDDDSSDESGPEAEVRVAVLQCAHGTPT